MRKTYLVAMAVVLLDQASKLIVDNWMTLGQSVPLISGVLHITYIKNPGAAFGILPGQQWFLIVVSFLVIAAMLFYAHRTSRDFLVQLALALMVGGASGNLVDRLLHGGVRDFIDFQVWPVFNVADSALVVGVGLLLLDLYLDWKGSKA